MTDKEKEQIKEIYKKIHNRIDHERKTHDLGVIYGLEIAMGYMDEYFGELDESD